MLFNSYQFIFVFLPISLALFYILKYFGLINLAKISLVISSLVFYAYFKISYLWILITSILVNYIIATLILKNTNGGGQNLTTLESKKIFARFLNIIDSIDPTPKTKKTILIFGIVFNIALLVYFKYTNFLLEILNMIIKFYDTDIFIILPNIVLPIALSFITFQKIAFLVDCYKQSINATEQNEKKINLNFLDYALFVTFFPQLIAGPIVHHREMMPQFAILDKTKAFPYENVAKGLFIFSIGLFKKVCLADSFAKIADAGFNTAKTGAILNFFSAWGTSLSYSFQIYFDFSGYCDMAIGLALFFSIILPINFNSPYKSLNIAEFWQKWHITLGRFLKQYLYIPLGGNRNERYKNDKDYTSKNKFLTLRNLFIVAFISGIWHGAGFGFVIWGILHGSAMVVHRIYTYFYQSLDSTRKYKIFMQSRIYKILCWLITFNFINITWVFFRAENIDSAISLIKGMFNLSTLSQISFLALLQDINAYHNTLLLIITSFAITLICKNSIECLKNFKANKIYVAFVAILLCTSLITILMNNGYQTFIYYNF